MPIKHSAKKALRQNKKRRLRNIGYKTKIKNLMKKAMFLYKENRKEDLSKIIPSLYRAFDIGAKVGILKKNTAARRKSVITKRLNSLK